MSCTTKGCIRKPTWEGRVSTKSTPASGIDVQYCAICLTAMEKKCHKESDIRIEFWPLEETGELESEVHRSFRVEAMPGTRSFRIVHKTCGGVLMVTQDVSIETLVLLPISHAADCTGYNPLD